jgi:hypothetical protein
LIVMVLIQRLSVKQRAIAPRTVIPGRAVRRGLGFRPLSQWLWIPGSRCARPGMTVGHDSVMMRHEEMTAAMCHLHGVIVRKPPRT